MNTSAAGLRFLLGCGLLGLATVPVQAQTIYRILGPNNQVILTDKPPADVRQATAVTPRGLPVATSNATLPFELRQAAEKYPVTLYSGAGCAPCVSGRQLLQARGIPFTELTVATQEDVDALQRISGDKSLPFLTVGGQKIKGFSETEWSQFLTAANYPARSLLPPTYRPQAPRPLVAVQRPEPAGANGRTEQNEEARTPASPAPDAEQQPSAANPSGIKF